MAIVLDCSITMAWCFDDEVSELSERALDEVDASYALVPELWSLEVSNSLLVAERKKRVSQAKSAAFLHQLGRLPIRFAPVTEWETFGRILPVARSCELTAYDAAYLELAMQTGLELASLDVKLRRAAKKAGAAVFS